MAAALKYDDAIIYDNVTAMITDRMKSMNDQPNNQQTIEWKKFYNRGKIKEKKELQKAKINKQEKKSCHEIAKK